MSAIYLALGLVVALGGAVLLAVHLAKRGQKYEDQAEALEKVLDDVQKANKAAAESDKLSDADILKRVFDKWSR